MANNPSNPNVRPNLFFTRNSIHFPPSMHGENSNDGSSNFLARDFAIVWDFACENINAWIKRGGESREEDSSLEKTCKMAT